MKGKINVGGGDNLNFKVVGGTTRPTNPKENTIWINTSTEIRSWRFENYNYLPTWSEPNGCVLINAQTSLNNNARAFNVVKKNGIWIELLKAYQIVNGVWSIKEMQIYRAGAWEATDLHIYNKGDEYTARTGGWTTFNYAAGTSSNYNYSLGSSANSSAGFTLTTGQNKSIARQTVNAIDLTNVNAVEVVLKSSLSSIYGAVEIAISTAAKQVYTKNVVAKWRETSKPPTSFTKKTIDVSNLTGSYYICVGQWYYSDGGSTLVTTVESIKLV